MIACYIKNKIFGAKLLQQINKDFMGINHCLFHDYDSKSIDFLYSKHVSAVVIELEFAPLPEKPWLEVLANIGKKIPVIVISQRGPQNSQQRVSMLSSNLLWVFKPEVSDIMQALHRFPLQTLQVVMEQRNQIPLFDAQIPLHVLQQHGSLAMISVHGIDFQKYGLSLGSDAYDRIQQLFMEILYNLWGATGSFRREDLLCRKSPTSNSYFIFLKPNRGIQSLPAPGVIESLAHRIGFRIHLALWEELLKFGAERKIPEGIKTIPKVSVGYATAIANPCLDQEEVVERTIQQSYKLAEVQNFRFMERLKEFMQCLIKTPDVLHAHFQGIFRLDQLEKKHVDAVKKEKSIAPLKDILYGFESLMRIRKENIPIEILNNAPFYVNVHSLRPDILFELARRSEIAMELDQACMLTAFKNFTNMSGRLLINILPRNLNYIERILPENHHSEVTFEVSEAEDIANFDLTLEIKEKLKRCDIGIAADDFGRGYTGLERILKVKPDLIKLDRSLVQDIHLDAPKRAFVMGVVQAVTQISGATLIAEGVELWEEAEVLKAMGIQLIQGFLLHKPQELSQIKAELKVAENESASENVIKSRFGSVA